MGPAVEEVPLSRTVSLSLDCPTIVTIDREIIDCGMASNRDVIQF